MKNTKKTSSVRRDFGGRLQGLRKKHGISQEELAAKLGYKTGGSISNIESGSAPIDTPALAKIAKMLDADLHLLIVGKMPPGATDLAESYSKAVLRLVYWVQEYMNDLQQRSEALRGEIEPLKEMHNRGMDVDMDRLSRLKTAHDLLLDKYRAAIKTLAEVLETLELGKGGE